MKIAFLLSGISYLDNYSHFSNRNYKIDWKLSLKNYKENILSFFNDDMIDIHICTNDISKYHQKEIYKDFTPKTATFISDECCQGCYPRNSRIKSVVNQCLNYNQEYDLVVITRFDLFFEIKLIDMIIDIEKFNLITTMQNECICDNFYLFPFKFLDPFLSIVQKNLYTHKSFHFIRNDIESISDINFMFDEKKDIKLLSSYKIVRSHPLKNKKYKFQEKRKFV